MTRLYTEPAPFDFNGKFYNLRGVSGKPNPVQKPWPVTLNAQRFHATRPRLRPHGRRIVCSPTFVEIGQSHEQISDMRDRAAAMGREVGVYTACHVVCRPSQAEAEEYYEHYAVTMEDTAGADHHMGSKARFSSSHDPEAYRSHRKRFVGGAGTYPLIGTPEHIAGKLAATSTAGFGGVALSFVNYKDELPYFIETVLPLLRDAGLRGEGG